MTIRSAAKTKTEKPFVPATNESTPCARCGHPFGAHQPRDPRTPDLLGPCPALPPGKDELRLYNEKEGRTHWDGTGFTTPPAKSKTDHPANCSTCKAAPYLLRVDGEVRAGHYADRNTAVTFAKKNLGLSRFEVITADGHAIDVVDLGKPNLADELAAADEEGQRKKLAAVNFEKRPGESYLHDVEISKLHAMKGNPRGDDLGDVSGLVKSIEMHGFIGTLFVRPLDGDDAPTDEFEVWAGNRRLKAAKEAGLKVLPCDVYQLTAGQALEMNMAEQINRNDLTPLKEGESCRRLMELQGYDEHQVAEKFGRSASWVTKRVALAGMAPELKKALTKDELPLTTALALAALPTHQQQVKAFDDLVDSSELRLGSVEEQIARIHRTQCRPLADASWKLTDADLVPEAGPCSACPKNSANNRQPGLYDNVKAKPTCSDLPCFADKELASWLKRTEKLKAAGAKVLSLNESRKVFGRGNDLPSDSRWVDADTKPPKDKKGRTWAELVADMPQDARPQLHVAEDNNGKVRQLYVTDKVLEAAATHLKAKWAKSVVEEAEEQRSERTPEGRAKKDAELAERALVEKVREEVAASVLDRVAASMAKDGGNFSLSAARFLASRLGERALERFAQATGKKKLPKDWLEKGANIDELLTLVWLDDAVDELGRCWDGFDERLLALAKAHGIDVEAAVKAQLATARAEAAK